MSAQTNSPTGWVGWGYFAGFMMMLLGIFQGIDGLAGIFKDNLLVRSWYRLYFATINKLF